MAEFYKYFVSSRTIFWTLFLCFMSVSFQAAASNPLFTVQGVEVDITAENALTARDQAFSQAQQEAFKILAQRMLTEAEAAGFIPPDSRVISPMIQDYEVTNEKLSSVRYIGTYTFRFQERAVRRYFSNAGVAYTDMSSEPLLILPFYQQGGDMVLWARDNPWMRAWSRAETGALVPIVLPIGDIADVNDIDDSEAFSYGPMKMRRMLSRYEASEAVLAIAVPDENMQLIDSENEPATGALTINVYRTDRAKPEHVQQFVVTAQPEQTYGALLDQAVQQVQAVLRKDWKQKTITSASQSNIFRARVRFDGFQQWAMAQRSLQRARGIEGLSVHSLSPRQAMVDLIFQGDEQRLRTALEQVNIRLGQAAGDPGGPGRIYDLYLSRYAPPVYTPTSQPRQFPAPQQPGQYNPPQPQKQPYSQQF